MASAPYDNLELVANLARSRILDMIVSQGGQTLTDTQTFTLTMINAAWRRLQSWLTSWGYPTLQDQIIISALPGLINVDPAVQTYLSWTGYFNGGSFVNSPFLPSNLIQPLEVSERPTPPSASLEMAFIDMDPFTGTPLPAVPKNMWNGSWQWRKDTLVMPGALQTTDIRILFSAYWPDFVAASTTPFVDQQVPIMRCLDPFASLVCSEFCVGRNDDVAYFDQQAMTAAGLIWPGAPQPQLPPIQQQPPAQQGTPS